eukprot:scaffold7115_cov125-Isochrysis_galbana.AAC.7
MAFAVGSQQDTHLDCEETPGGTALDVELDDVVVAIRSREVRRRRKLLRTSTPAAARAACGALGGWGEQRRCCCPRWSQHRIRSVTPSTPADANITSTSASGSVPAQPWQWRASFACGPSCGVKKHTTTAIQEGMLEERDPLPLSVLPVSPSGARARGAHMEIDLKAAEQVIRVPIVLVIHVHLDVPGLPHLGSRRVVAASPLEFLVDPNRLEIPIGFLPNRRLLGGAPARLLEVHRLARPV